MNREFGVLNKVLHLEFGPYTIATIPAAGSSIEWIRSQDILVGDWIDPERDHPIRAGEYGAASNAWMFFALPHTHEISCAGGGDEIEREVEFIITYFGFLMGVRLIPDGWRHHTRTPLKVHRLLDLHCSPPALERLLSEAVEFWRRLPDTLSRKRLFAAVHWWLLGQCIQEHYQAFAAHYTALDACWHVWCAKTGRNPRDGNHTARPGILCEALGVPLPTWAKKRLSGDSTLASVRNQLLHEGLYGGEAVGFSFPTGDEDFELAWLVSRLLVSLLGGSNSYTSSKFDGQDRLLEH